MSVSQPVSEVNPLVSLARAFACQRPELAPRIEKALRIIEGGHIQPHPYEPGVVYVYGSAGEPYRVEVGACTCPDFAQRGVVCKHQWARKLWIAAQETLRDTEGGGTPKRLRVVAMVKKGATPKPKRPTVRESMKRLEGVTRAHEAANTEGIGASQ